MEKLTEIEVMFVWVRSQISKSNKPKYEAVYVVVDKIILFNFVQLKYQYFCVFLTRH